MPMPAPTRTRSCCPAGRHATIPSSEFEFDRVLGPSASQSDVYHAAVKPIVEDVLNGWAAAAVWGAVLLCWL